MKIQELKKVNEQELFKTLEEKRKKVQELRMALATEKVKNIKELRETKKDIAKILTVLNNK